MFSRWPIRNKLIVGVILLLVIVGVLAINGVRGSYAYRAVVRSVSRRAAELPLATKLARHVSDLRVTLSHARRPEVDLPSPACPPVDGQMLREQFRQDLAAVEESLAQYRRQLDSVHPDDQQIGDNRRERETVRKFQSTLTTVRQLDRQEDWTLDAASIEQLGPHLEMLDELSAELPSFLQQRMQRFATEVRSQYRTWIIMGWVTAAGAGSLLFVLFRLAYVYIFKPLGVLITGSRRVAGGDFQHQIELPTHDEMADLATAMNDMTGRFRQIRDNLDRQVKIRTRQVVRSEQLASVGFLAAGVAHEINNPLASIAWCAESLETRLHDIIVADDEKPDDAHNEEITVLRNYLRMIQDESFRCKQITEKLLDFSRMGDVQRHRADLAELVQGVIDMVGHLGKYKNKNVRFEAAGPVVAAVNSQEIKQVLLNLVTNALDSLEPGGTVLVALNTAEGTAQIVLTDDGCGMTDEVRKHLFEPFFTRRRDGQGTGLGLSIAYRIIADHGGCIEAHSDGPGTGSQFRVTLPTDQDQKEHDHRNKAA